MRLGMVWTVYRRQLQHRDDQVTAGLRLAAEKGCAVYSGPLGDWRDAAQREQVATLRESLGLELEGGWGYDFVLADAETAARALDRLDEYLEVACPALGITTLGTCAHTDRWRKEPPALDEALERIAAALAPAAARCAARGCRLALENHADYRGHEIAWVIAAVDSPGLRARLDTGNAFWTFEDPLDAAEALAPYTITTHMKDIEILQYGRHRGAVLGQGHVDFPRIIELLRERSPEPERLPLIAEVEALPEGTDEAAAGDASLAYLRGLCGGAA